MIKKISTVSLILIAVSCDSITDNESKAIDDILKFYGGACKYSVGFIESTDDKEDKKYFEIELTNSVALSRYADRPEWTTSNLAYRFYKHLNLEERQTYTHIRGTLLLDNGDKIKHDYSIEELEVVDKKMKIVSDVIEKIKQKKFDDLKSYLNPENNFTYNKDDVINDLKNYESQFGKILEFRLFGFKYTSADTKPILTIFGAMIRDVQYTEIKISINPKSEKTEVMAVKYDW
jgi:hypothetical protein